MAHKIFTCLWFDGKAKEAATYYCTIFKNSKILSENPMTVIFELNDTKFMALNGGPHYKFSPASSYVITCDTQEEIDHYWEKLGRAENTVNVDGLMINLAYPGKLFQKFWENS